MLASHVSSLDKHHSALLLEIAGNPALNLLLSMEKQQLEGFILCSYQKEGESDGAYLRRLAEDKIKLIFINELLALLTDQASKLQN